jgi:hypothetical protein
MVDGGADQRDVEDAEGQCGIAQEVRHERCHADGIDRKPQPAIPCPQVRLDEMIQNRLARYGLFSRPIVGDNADGCHVCASVGVSAPGQSGERLVGLSCHCEERSDAAISIEAPEIASLRSQ